MCKFLPRSILCCRPPAWLFLTSAFFPFLGRWIPRSDLERNGGRGRPGVRERAVNDASSSGQIDGRADRPTTMSSILVFSQKTKQERKQEQKRRKNKERSRRDFMHFDEITTNEPINGQTDQPMDGRTIHPTDGQTSPLIEMRARRVRRWLDERLGRHCVL